MPDNIANPLNSLERTTLRNCEKMIEKGCQTFMEVGKALMEIRDGDLHRETHKSFKSYCDDKWGFSDRRARQLMDGAEVAKVVESGTRVPLSSEKQARYLTKLAESQRQPAWLDAVDKADGGQPTAVQVKEVVDLYLADNEPYVEEPEAEDVEEANSPPGTPALPKCSKEFQEAVKDGAVKLTKEQAATLNGLPPKKRRQAELDIMGGKSAAHAINPYRPKVKTVSPEEKELAAAKDQIKIWADTVGRFLNKRPTIDELRDKWPGKQGDHVVKMATQFYESLKNWQKVIK